MSRSAGEWYEDEDEDGVLWRRPVKATSQEFGELIHQFVEYLRGNHVDVPHGKIRARRSSGMSVTMGGQDATWVSYPASCYVLPHLSSQQSGLLTALLSSGILWGSGSQEHQSARRAFLRAEAPALDFCVRNPMTRRLADTRSARAYYRSVLRSGMFPTRIIPDASLLSCSIFGLVGVSGEDLHSAEYVEYDRKLRENEDSCGVFVQEIQDTCRKQRLIALGMIMPTGLRLLKPLPRTVVGLLRQLDAGLDNYVHVYADAVPTGTIRATISLTNKGWPEADDTRPYLSGATEICVPGRITMRRVLKTNSISRLDLEGTPDAVVQVARALRATLKLPNGFSLPA